MTTSIRSPDQVDLRPPLFARLLPIVLMGYVFLDRGFAWLHIPGIPLYPSEVVLIVGLTFSIRGMVRWTGWRLNVVPLLVAFAGWGLIRTIPNLFGDVEATLRDAASWIYILLVFAIFEVLMRRAEILPTWLQSYRRLLLPIVILPPIAVLLSELVEGVAVPDSDVSIFSYKPGNAAVHVFLALAFLWTVWRPDRLREVRWRISMTGAAAAGILVVSTQGRGGLVAVMVGGAVLFMLASHRSQLMRAVAGSLLVVAVAVVVIDPTLSAGGREFSAGQFTDNLSSIVTGEGEGELGGNVDWRLYHWSEVWDGVNRDVPFTGHGFGVNIAELYGIPQADIGLRNAHNSHLTVLARMGWVGMGLWLAIWLFWFLETIRAARRLRATGLDRLAGLATWAVIGVTAIHVNAIFDPTLEGPQVALWLWTFTALGVYVTVCSWLERRGSGSASAVSRINEGIDRALQSGSR